jgi:signal transduction histidine kinase
VKVSGQPSCHKLLPFDLCASVFPCTASANGVDRRALLEHFVSAAEEERQRIAADIHDDSIQAISAAGLRLQLLRRALDDPVHLELLGDLEQTIQLSISRLRHLLFGLRPPALDQEGLVPALRTYLKQTKDESTTRFNLDDRLHSEPREQARLILYRIAQEALTNVRKHSEAKTAEIRLEERHGGFFVRITDDGIGFAGDDSSPTPGHLGLAAMRERAELSGGSLAGRECAAVGDNSRGLDPVARRRLERRLARGAGTLREGSGLVSATRIGVCDRA